jgi:hypothetical protein
VSLSLPLRDLTPRDSLVLRDLVRFGVLAGDQIDRRYGDPGVATARLQLLVDADLVARWSPLIKDTTVYSATTVGAGVARCDLRATRPSLEHLRHDIAVVDLADYLLEHEPAAEWRTEREVGRTLRAGRLPTRIGGLPARPTHKPDGLLLTSGRRLAIELEHSDKGDLRYAYICRWFALTVGVDGVRWYVDDPRIIARLRRVHQQHGFDEDVDFTCEPFPPGVTVRPWVHP